jgi:hypothetical protein
VAEHDLLWEQLLQRKVFVPHIIKGFATVHGKSVLEAWRDFDVDSMPVKCLKENLQTRRVSLDGLIEKKDLRSRLMQAVDENDLPPVPAHRGSSEFLQNSIKRCYCASIRASRLARSDFLINDVEARFDRLFTGRNAHWDPNWTPRLLVMRGNTFYVYSGADKSDLMASWTLDPDANELREYVVAGRSSPPWAHGQPVRAFSILGLQVDALFAPQSPTEYAILTERMRHALVPHRVASPFVYAAERAALRGFHGRMRSLALDETDEACLGLTPAVQVEMAPC